ncbi:MAG: hypothetical protein GY822_28940 [Deltaproteobacteria bacterium]|nr:hypothetical protein [Deltaproteobacteria bacterium]
MKQSHENSSVPLSRQKRRELGGDISFPNLNASTCNRSAFCWFFDGIFRFALLSALFSQVGVEVLPEIRRVKGKSTLIEQQIYTFVYD